MCVFSYSFSDNMLYDFGAIVLHVFLLFLLTLGHFFVIFELLGPLWRPLGCQGRFWDHFLKDSGVHLGPSGSTFGDIFWCIFRYFFRSLLEHWFTDFWWIFNLILGAFWGNFSNKLILWKSRSRLHGNLDQEGPGGPKNWLFPLLFEISLGAFTLAVCLSILGLILAPRWESWGQLFDMFSHPVFFANFLWFPGCP